MGKPKKLVDPPQIFRQAVSFEYSARALASVDSSHREMYMTKHGTGHGLGISVWCPTLQATRMLAAFAIELYLKYLIRTDTGNNPPAMGHDLLRYFEKLSKPLQARIKDYFYQMGLAHSDANVAALFAGEATKELHFNNDLEFARHSFERWRYSYEEVPYPGHVHPQLLCTFRCFIADSDPQCKSMLAGLPPPALPTSV